MQVPSTKQLRVIHAVMNAKERPVSIEEIHRGARTQAHCLGVATVYRLMKASVDEGIVVAVDLPGEGARFEMSGKGHHHHLQCNASGRVFETKPCLDDLPRLMPRRFELSGPEIVLYGRCVECH